jgi:hypothetical protein
LACATDYVQEGDSCKRCDGGADFETALIPIMMLCGLLYVFAIAYLLRNAALVSKNNSLEKNDNNFLQRVKRMKKSNSLFGQGKILISMLQIIESMPSVLVGVKFSKFFQSFAKGLSIFNLDFLSLSSALGCKMSVRFFDRFIIHLLLPIFCIMTIGLALGTTFLCISRKQVNKRRKIKEDVSKIFILVILLLFPGLVTKIFSMFRCQTFDGIEDKLLLVQDFSINCYYGEHVTFSFVAWIFLLLYVLGIPFMIFFLLWSNKKYLHDIESKKHRMVKNSLGGLYLQYEPDYWWFELVILVNKTIMCGGLVLFSPGTPSQVLFAVIIMLFHLLLTLKTAPYQNQSEDWSSVASALGLTLIYIGALVKKLEADLTYVDTMLNVLPVICTLILVGIIILFDFGLYDKLKCWTKNNKIQEKTTRKNGRFQRKLSLQNVQTVVNMDKVDKLEKDTAEHRTAALQKIQARRENADARLRKKLNDRQKQKSKNEKKKGKQKFAAPVKVQERMPFVQEVSNSGSVMVGPAQVLGK